jgi:hypothetical protein
MTSITTNYPKTLLVALMQDADKRLAVLHQEVEHLTSVLQSRVLQSKRHISENLLIDILPIAKSSEQLIASVSLLQTEISELRKSNKKLRRELDNQVFADSSSNDEQNWLKLGCLLGAIRFRTCLMVKELGDLHERFDQALRHVSPDHPEPTIRRLRDTSVSDRYLNELSRWTYRDVAHFATSEKLLRGAYPYFDIPQVYQLRDYAENSSHHSVNTTAGEGRWRNWWKHRSALQAQAKLKEGRPEKYVMIHTPFWLPDILEVAPVIAHEVAHEVIEDCFGHEIDLEQRPSDSQTPLAQLFAGYSKILGVALYPYAPLNEAVAMQNAREFLADFLAFSRFRVAYVYCAFFMMLEAGYFAGFCRDAVGHWHLPEILHRWSNATSSAFRNNVSFLKDMRIRNDMEATNLLVFLARIELLCSLGKSLNNSTFEVKALLEIEQFVKEMVKQVATVDFSSDQYEKLLKNLRALHDAKMVPYGLALDSELGEPKMRSVTDTLKELWNQPGENELNFFLVRQRLSKKFFGEASKNTIKSKLRGKERSDSATDPKPEIRLGAELEDLFSEQDSAQDIAFRFAWRRAEVEATLSDPSTIDVAEGVNDLDAQYMPIKFAMIEDYVFRTAPPDSFFNALVTKSQKQPNNGASPGKPKLFHEVFALEELFKSHDELKEYLLELKKVGDFSAINSMDALVHNLLNELPNHMVREYLMKEVFPAVEKTDSPLVQTLYEAGRTALKEVDRVKLRGVTDNNPTSSLFDSGSVGWALTLFSVQYKPVERLEPNLASDINRSSKTAFFQNLRNIYDAYKVPCFLGEVLGRYDIASLHPIKGHRSESQKVILLAKEQLKNVNLVRYEHKLVNIGEVKGLDKIYAVISVALVSPMAHRTFAFWLKHAVSDRSMGGGLFANIFVSEGWEDFIILIAQSDGSNRLNLFEPVGRLVSSITSHALTYKTETMFTQLALRPELIDFPKNGGIEFRLRCRAESVGGIDAKKLSKSWSAELTTRLQEKWAQSLCSPGAWAAVNDLLEVKMLTGLTDLEVRFLAGRVAALPSDLVLAAVAILRDVINEDHRIQRLNTQISF